MNNEILHLKQAVERANFKLTKQEIRGFRSIHTSYLLSKFGDISEKKFEVYLQDGTKLLSSFNRIVIGAHGPYIEFEDTHLEQELEIPQDQLWRKDPKYKVKYIWLTPVGKSDKIYSQVRTVDYADYRVGKYYIDLYSVKFNASETFRDDALPCKQWNGVRFLAEAPKK